jgi:hypothetical protein
MDLVIYILFIILLVCWLLTIKREGFESMPTEYRKLPCTPYRLTNIPEYMANSWHLRFPYMVNQRYAYDYLNESRKPPYPGFYPYGKLKELEIQDYWKNKGIYGYDYQDYYDNSFSDDKID